MKEFRGRSSCSVCVSMLALAPQAAIAIPSESADGQLSAKDRRNRQLIDQQFQHNDNFDADAAIAAGLGRNGVETPTALMDSCASEAVQNALNGVGAAVAGAIAAFLWAQGGLIGVCNSWGTGVRMFPTVVTAIWACVAQ